MSYNEIVKKYAGMTGVTVADAKRVCNTMLAIIEDAVMNGESVDVYGFGKLDILETPAKDVKGLDGKVYHVPTKRRLTFKTSKVFAARMSEGL